VSLQEILKGERDEAAAEAVFERNRADQAVLRNLALRDEVRGLRRQLRELLGENHALESNQDSGSAQLAEQLGLAVETNWRLERDRAHLARKAQELQARVQDQAGELARLRARVRALQGQLRLVSAENTQS
jgi:regulator of replication initiation timing